VALSADGKLLARGAIDGVVDVWDVATGKKLHKLKGHTASVCRVAFSPDGKTLASAATTWGIWPPGAEEARGPGEMKLWDLVTGKERVTLKGHPGLALSLAFSPDGKTLATESGGTEEEAENDPSGLVKLWDVDTGKVKLELKQDNYVQSLAFAPDGKTLAVGTGGFFIEPPRTARPWPR
jgi:WD40 repeat protein